ncbi:MAG: bifunctional 3-(3-hydroxy-phenyl)propionate/3-hydroxycinnamic acid hydroxylase [Alphaproteobacteria bacterium]
MSVAGSGGDEVLDAAIVGLGPAGVAVGAMLARRGLRVAAFEREPGVFHMPRAVHFDGDVMRNFQSIGACDDLRDCTVVGEGMHFVNADGKTLLAIDAKALAGDSGWDLSYFFHQPALETVLRKHASAAGLAMHLRHEVEAIEPGDAADPSKPASIRVRDLATGAVREVRAAWVLGCDGARSLARVATGTVLDDLRFDQPWLVCDVVLRRDVDLPRWAVQYCDPARPSTYVPIAGRRRRWEFMLMPGETREELERPERVAAMLAPWLGPDDAEIERATVYVFHALIASPWRRERVLLLGDAAHQTPPFLGQGMCAGMRDAANLAWKIDLVQRGLASRALLDSYEHERSPHVRRVIESAVAAGGLIQTTDPEVAKARDEMFLSGNAPSPIDLVPRATDGVYDDRPDDAAAGKPLPQPRDGAGRLLDDSLGDGFAVVGADDPRAACGADAVGRLERVGARFVAAPALRPWLAKVGAVAAVVRPDRFVYGSARDAADLDRLVRGLADRLGAPGA